MENSRREFLFKLGLLTASASLGLTEAEANTPAKKKRFFKISLMEYSFHRAIESGKLDNLDFPAKARKEFDISAIDYLNLYFQDKARDLNYLNELKRRCDDNGIKSQVICCDGEGDLGSPDKALRKQAIENHMHWVDAAKLLRCHSIRVNCYGTGAPEEVAKSGAEGLRSLSEYAKKLRMNVLVENHDGISSNPEWVLGVVKSVGMSNCGTLPDFDNFQISKSEEYDRYKGVEMLMPLARSVSAKALNFDEAGNCKETDYRRMLKIVKDSGYKGYLSAEYEWQEGSILSEEDGVRATIKLLRRVGEELSSERKS